MARSRNIKPGILKNEILGSADALYTILFEGLWMLADREGRLEDRPLRIRAEVFPYRDGADVDLMLSWLADHGFIVRYESAGRKYLEVVNFLEHQKPHPNEPDSRIPPPPEPSGESPSTNGASPSTIGARETAKDASDPAYSLNADSLLTEGQAPRSAVLTSEEFQAAWNESASVSGWKPCRQMTTDRKASFRQRLRDPNWRDSWREALVRAGPIPGLRGENPRKWRANVDWFLRPDTVTRILEGGYDGWSEGGQHGNASGTRGRSAGGGHGPPRIPGRVYDDDPAAPEGGPPPAGPPATRGPHPPGEGPEPGFG